MRVILLGATGMVGQGVLRECLRDTRITQVTAVGRRPSGVVDPKVEDLVRPELFTPPFAWEDAAGLLFGYDACFFCLGVSAAGMREADYGHVTFDLTLAAAHALVRGNPSMAFIYVSGRGTDSSERGRIMWARVKGRTENALLELPFRRAHMFRLGAVAPVDGARSSTRWYRYLYAALGPVMPLLRRAFPDGIVTSSEVGRAMIEAVVSGDAKAILESRDIAALARRGSRG